MSEKYSEFITIQRSTNLFSPHPRSKAYAQKTHAVQGFIDERLLRLLRRRAQDD